MPNEFAFVAQPDLAYLGNLERLYPDDPMLTAGYFNAGFWLAAPDKRMFEYLISLIDMKARPFNTNLPEQNLLNYAFRHCDYFQDQHLHCKTGGPLGPMPWIKADTLWSSNRPTLKDYAFGVRALHYKGWETPTSSPLRTLWEEIRNQTLTDNMHDGKLPSGQVPVRSTTANPSTQHGAIHKTQRAGPIRTMSRSSQKVVSYVKTLATLYIVEIQWASGVKEAIVIEHTME
ncbi:hypothetical protein CFIMG_005839RAa [Ceratocystis fimbriata CBS 114723]|uniref:Uncharacterized protein n=1 Tax=Ceratocystis fimbriata CBS 114723 TaxID=1035309 RepID=A0A2C5WZZ2_9PEZI|nr:hypothetical protein CFIMG_005839RAa [Ceratocystis fimbriata CBS 114723]